jgi:hypothetical protein
MNPKQIYLNRDIDRQEIYVERNPKGTMLHLRLAPPSKYWDGGKSYSNTGFSSRFQMGGPNGTGIPTDASDHANPNPGFSTPNNPISNNPPVGNQSGTGITNSSSNSNPSSSVGNANSNNAGVGDSVSTQTPSDKQGVIPPNGRGTDYSVLAQATYKHANVPGFTIDNQFTNNSTTVYVAKDGQVVIAYSGTKFHKGFKTAVKDFWADLHINNGTEESSSEFHQARELARAVIHKYGKSVVTATGHSLGGTKAIYVSSLFGIWAYVYDAGWAGTEATKPVKKGIFDKHNNTYVWHLDKVLGFNAWGDPVSFLQGKTVKHQTIMTDASISLKQALWDAGGEALTLTGLKDTVWSWAKSFMTTKVMGPGGGYQAVPTSEENIVGALEKSGITEAEVQAQNAVADGAAEAVIVAALLTEVVILAYHAVKTHGIKEFQGFHTASVK